MFTENILLEYDNHIISCNLNEICKKYRTTGQLLEMIEWMKLIIKKIIVR